MLLDTGSHALWVASSNSSGCGDRRKKFKSSESDSFVNLNRSKQYRYIKARVEGKTATDIVHLSSLAVNHEILLVEKCVLDKYSSFDGVIGFGSGKQNKNILDEGYADGQLVSSLYAISLSLDSNKKSFFYYNFTLKDFPTAFYL